jgi:hypothetical protein
VPTGEEEVQTTPQGLAFRPNNKETNKKLMICVKLSEQSKNEIK